MSKQGWFTIDELMAGKAPGSVELVNGAGIGFKPYFRSYTGYWHGVLDGDTPDNYNGATASWKVYTPPPAPPERSQLWWVFTDKWHLTHHAATEDTIRQVYTEYRPSGIYAPEEESV